MGQLATGFRDIELSATNSGTYYFEPSESNETKGKMVKGWQDQGGSTRYFETGAESPAQNLSAKTGQMAIGFTMIRLSDSNVGTYYFEPIGSDSIRGRMLKGWQSISGGIYYFNPDKNVSRRTAP